MTDLKNRIAKNLEKIQARIAAAANRAGRAPDSVQLVAITKTVGLEEVEILKELGVTHFGENRLEVAASKIAVFPELCWHMIGNIQRRKARDIIQLFSKVDAVDRLKLAETLEKRCEEHKTSCSILIEVNVSGEESKHGICPEKLEETLTAIQAMEHLRVEGLLTMAPLGAAEAQIRGYFRTLYQLAQQYTLPELSMGMTDDFEIAIEEGATQIRIGRALFE